MKITQALLHDLFHYDEDTGELYWRKRPLEHFETQRAWATWNTRFSGTRAGTIVKGYNAITISGRRYYAHRLVYYMFTGEWPEEVDHINGDIAQNNFANLRATTHLVNCRNQRLRSTNKSGHHGVSKVSKTTYLARITDRGRTVSLGRFPTKELAIAARRKAERELGYAPTHGRAA